jgi:glycerophosphoryl diester phosphodiesterase
MQITDVIAPLTMRAAGVDWVAVTPQATQAYINSCRAANLRVAMWTINDRAGRDAALARGVQAIMTDDPVRLAA